MATSSRVRRRVLAQIASVCAILVLSAAPVSGTSVDPYFGPHAGNYGVHALVDEAEGNNGVTCVYGADHKLKKLKIRAPIVFAYDRTGGVDTQWVGQRYIIEWDNNLPGGGYENWPNHAVSSWVKATATDATPASWSGRTFTFGANVVDHIRYRVSILMKWYAPFPSQTHVDGSALDVVQWYRYKGLSNGVREGYCFSDETF